MRPTLFHIPHEFLGIPVLGMGWACIGWLIGLGIICLVTARQSGWRAALSELIPFAAVGTAVLIFLLPHVEERVVIDGVMTNLGLPIRSYGVLMCIAVIAGVSMAIQRGTRVGLCRDDILAVCTWMLVAGFLGARIFYVVQYHERFHAETWLGYWKSAVNVTEGGLVVYGSLVGALIAFTTFAIRKQLPSLVLADILAPSLLLGLAIGRVGCLMNGCCYGGPCEHEWAVTFPQQSLPYMNQLERGMAQGVYLVRDDDGAVVIKTVAEDSNAARAGLVSGSVVQAINGVSTTADGGLDRACQTLLQSPPGTMVSFKTATGVYRWTADFAPQRSLPTHPTQLYSTVNALALMALLLALEPWMNQDGALLALTLTLYPMTRFMLEIVRRDEPAHNALGFTISQSVSVGIIVMAMILWWLVARQPQGRHVAIASPE